MTCNQLEKNRCDQIYILDSTCSSLAIKTRQKIQFRAALPGIALAIDYSLFMLTRYMEEVQSGASTEMALKSMMRQSGHVVMISASVLIICYVS